MMAAAGFLGLDAVSERQIHHVSTAPGTGRVTRENEEKVQNVNGVGIEYSHGRNWFRRQKIGQGGGGSVYLADRGFPFQMAVKSAPMPRSSSISDERRVFSVLNGSPNLVCCYGDEITETESGDSIYNLLIEYCSGGSLDDHIMQSKNGLPEDEVASFARDIARGLEYMHKKGYAHCDIKPENILLSPEKASSSRKVKYAAKIADFGLSLNLFKEDEDRFSVRGTSRYMAPEMVRDVQIGFSADIWSYGCTVLEMLTGEPVWGAELMEKTDQEAMKHIGYSYESPKIPDHLSKKAKDFLSKCLDPVHVRRRWSPAMLLKHPFLSDTTTRRYRCCRH